MREFERHDLLVRLAAGVDSALSELERSQTERLLGLFRERLGLLGRKVVLTSGNGDQRGRLTDLDFESATLDGGNAVPLAIVQGLRQQ